MDTGAPLGQSLAPEIQPGASNGKRAHVVEGFIVTDNPLLTTMKGVERLAFVGGGLSLIYNSTLHSLQALSNLTHIRGSVDILANDALASLDGLQQLTGVEGYLEVGGKPVVAGPGRIEQSGGGRVGPRDLVQRLPAQSRRTGQPCPHRRPGDSGPQPGSAGPSCAGSS